MSTDENAVRWVGSSLHDAYRSNPRFAEYVYDFTPQESIDNARHDAYTAFVARTGIHISFHAGRWGLGVGSGAPLIVIPFLDGDTPRRTSDAVRSLCRTMSLPADVVQRVMESLESNEKKCDEAIDKTKNEHRPEFPDREDYESSSEYAEALEAYNHEKESGPPSVRPPEGFDDRRRGERLKFDKAFDDALDLNVKLSKEVAVAERDAAVNEAARLALDTERTDTRSLNYAQGYGPTAAWCKLPAACYRVASIFSNASRTAQ